MANVAEAIQYLKNCAEHAERTADSYAAFGRIGSDDAESLEKPTRDHAKRLAELAKAVADLEDAARDLFVNHHNFPVVFLQLRLKQLLGIAPLFPVAKRTRRSLSRE